MVMAILLSLSPHPPKPPRNPNPNTLKPISPSTFNPNTLLNSSRRHFILNSISLCFLSSTFNCSLIPMCTAETLPSKSILSAIANTKSWFQFYGDGFAIRVPPQFEDMTEPEVSCTISRSKNRLRGQFGGLLCKASPCTERIIMLDYPFTEIRLSQRHSQPDLHLPMGKIGQASFLYSISAVLGPSCSLVEADSGCVKRNQSRSEVVSVLIRPSNQLKITFLEAKDITDLGTLKEAAKIFVPGGSTIYSARTIKVREDESFKTYYFYEFGRDGQHVALVAAVNSGKAIVAGASAPQSKWEDDGVKLRSAAVSLTVL
ncbi:hypothetical protein RHMOL_Rhmol07G0228600 [Rhododendron molle]|uniref:Uncharacterized protein n=1 Tax=Rhododendron molle TaxID=49168 RepID=A0ACC0N5S0_RHOML|nr:hypothetical protein RHMOL_Rhmol07G0228600 [Rhododendron molle]